MLSTLLVLLSSAGAAEPVAQDLSALKEEIDLSIRWLRSVQDPKTGSYGFGVRDTSAVLSALATCPRHYTRADGPFVALALDHLIGLQSEEGWIATPGAEPAAVLVQTRQAALALFGFVDPVTTPALGRAVSWLARQGLSDPSGGEPLPNPWLHPTRRDFAADKTRAAAWATSLLARRRGNGSWRGPDAQDVWATATAVTDLSVCQPLFARSAATPDGATPLPPIQGVDRDAVRASMLKGARFLLASGEAGKWGAPGEPDAGLTAMVVGALQALPRPRPADIQKVIDEDLQWIASLQRDDGSIHQGRLANYVTSSCILALARSDGDTYAKVIGRAQGFLLNLQADEGEGYSADHPFYGGIGYGGDERPDLSNLQMALEALVASGLEKDHAAFDRAVRFLERCQNRSESNDFELQSAEGRIVAGNDGGAGYYPGNSKAGFEVLADGTKIPRSYGSMTYALLKGLVFSGLDAEDERVQACWKWLSEHYTLDVNPGFEHSSDPTAAYQGLFYYFHSMARALSVFGAKEIIDGEGRSHDWRAELAGRLVAMQSRLDGSWVNANAPRWWEGNPVLATAYALLTLGETL
jgi:squalene-hopene/tetraprenyl-beta-curcumene cyclase